MTERLGDQFRSHEHRRFRNSVGNRLNNPARPGERAPGMARYRLDGEWEHQEQLPDLSRSRVANVHLEPCLAERHNTAKQDRRGATTILPIRPLIAVPRPPRHGEGVRQL